MSGNLKPVPPTHAEPVRVGNLYRLAIVGASSLKGKEVAEVLNDRNFPSRDVKLLDDDVTLGQLEEAGGEVTFIQSVRPDQFDKLDFTFFAADVASTQKSWKTARKAGSSIVDLSFALEDEPDAVVRSPWVERQLGKLPTVELQPGPAVIAHPAAVILALLLLRIKKAGAIRRAAATIFEPASEHGQKGMDELHEQTVNLLSFQQLPKAVFDAQVAFNMLAHYGEQSFPPLDTLQQRVLRHYQIIAGKGAIAPSLLLLQAPIFHGYTLALHVEMQVDVPLETISQSLAGEHVSLSSSSADSPSNVSAAGQSDISVSLLPDVSQAQSFWLWAAADNLRVAASTAVECAEFMAVSRPRGKIQ